MIPLIRQRSSAHASRCGWRSWRPCSICRPGSGRCCCCATCCSGRPPRWPTRSAPARPPSTACCSVRVRNSKPPGPAADDRLAAPDSADAQDRLTRYIAAFEAYDIDRLVELFTREAIWEMPPFVGWYQGPQAIITLIHQQCPAQTPGDMRLIPLTANGQPAAAMYMRDGDDHVPFQLHVLDMRRRRGVAGGGLPGHRAVREIRPAGTALSRRVASYATRSRKIRAITGHSAPA